MRAPFFEGPQQIATLGAKDGRWWGVWRLMNVAFEEPLTLREYRACTVSVARCCWRATCAARATSGGAIRTLRRRMAAIGSRSRGARRPGGTPTRDGSWSATARPWSLSQAFYNFKLYVGGQRGPRSSSARWDNTAFVQLALI